MAYNEELEKTEQFVCNSFSSDYDSSFVCSIYQIINIINLSLICLPPLHSSSHTPLSLDDVIELVDLHMEEGNPP